MTQREVWDAYDAEGNKLGFDLYRDEADKIPFGAYHIVVEIYTVTKDNEVLTTRRHPDKGWGLKWEITGGSALKGETPEQGALRELREETGVVVKAEDLRLVYSLYSRDENALYYCYLAIIDKANQTFRLQEGETVDYRFLPYTEFKAFVHTEKYAPPVRERFLAHEELFDRMILFRAK